MRNIIKKERAIIHDGKRRVVSKKAKYFLGSIKNDFQTEHAIIKKEQLEACGSFTINKDEFIVYPGTFADKYKRVKRGPQIITPKDLGLILLETGINPNSIILEAGVGSGAATAYLALIGKKVHSFDISQDSLNVSRENLKKLNVPEEKYEIKEASIYNADEINFENYFDVFLLDVPEPEKALETAKKVLKVGGHLVLYTPHITQALKAINSLSDEFIVEKTSEVIEREWRVRGKMARPESKDFGHTAFLTFIRKVL